MKTHVIITFTKIHYFITQIQFEAIKKMSSRENVTIDGNIINTNNIADILTIEKYYETYPNEKPVIHKEVETYERVVYSKQQLINALTQMIKGFRKYFGNKQLSLKSQNILNHMERKLKQVEQTSKDKTYSNPVWNFYHDS